MYQERRIWKGDSCLIYKRCSKEEQDGSLEDQESTISTVRKDLELSRVLASFEDDGKRGHDENRPGLLAILSYVRTHPNPVRNNSDFIPILVYELSRFGRFDDSKKIFAYFVDIERYGYEFYSVTDKIRSRGNIADFVQAIIKSEQAYDYSVNLSKYGMRAGCSLAKRGWWPGGAAPYGMDRMTYGPDGQPKYRYVTLPDKTVQKYDLDGNLIETLPPIEDKGRIRSAYSDKIKSDKVKLAPGRPELVEVVRAIFEKFVKDGWGLRRIAGWLNDRGIQPPRGRHWLHSTVRSILRNAAYKGAIVYGRKSDGKHHWLTIKKGPEGYAPIIERKDVPGRTFVCRTEEECIVVEDCHEPAISKAIWEKAKALLKTRGHGKQSGLGARSSYLLSGDGLLKCARCGYRFQGDTDRRSKIRRYMDSGYHMGGLAICRCYMIPADALENWVIDEIQARILDGRAGLFAGREDLEKAIEQALLAGREDSPKKDSEIPALEQKLADRKKKIDLLLSNISTENLPLLNDHLARLRKEMEAIENELRALRVANRAEDVVTRDLKALAKEAAGYVVNLRKVLDSGSSDEKKRFVRDFVAEAVVDGEKREVRVGFYSDDSGPLRNITERAAGVDVPLWLAPPTGFEPVSRP